jgi:hypothetical protein
MYRVPDELLHQFWGYTLKTCIAGFLKMSDSFHKTALPHLSKETNFQMYRPPWSSGQSSWLQIQTSVLVSHRDQIFLNVVG